MRYLLFSIVLFVCIVLFATLASATSKSGSNHANSLADSTAVAGAASRAHAVAGGADVRNNINLDLSSSHSNELNSMVGVGVEFNNPTTNNNANTLSQEQSQSTYSTSVGNYSTSTVGSVNNSVGGQTQEANNEGVSNTTVVHGDQATDLSRALGTPASVYIDACSAGASASMPGVGATFGQGNPVCLWLAMAGVAHQQGNVELAEKFLLEAEKSLRMQTAVTRWINWVPLVGRLF